LIAVAAYTSIPTGKESNGNREVPGRIILPGSADADPANQSELQRQGDHRVGAGQRLEESRRGSQGRMGPPDLYLVLEALAGTDRIIIVHGGKTDPRQDEKVFVTCSPAWDSSPLAWRKTDPTRLSDNP
jgi:hypothetical protein